MFNRQPFNRGRFNRPSQATFDIYGSSSLKINSSIKADRTISAVGLSSLVLGSHMDAVSAVYGIGVSQLVLDTELKPTRIIASVQTMSSLVMASSADHTLGGEESIFLKGVKLPPGGDIVINTCDMTVLVNGANGLEWVDATSEFFNFLRGPNELVYRDNASRRNVSMDILWKDRWL